MKIEATLKDNLYELTTVHNSIPTKPYACFALSKEVSALCRTLVVTLDPSLVDSTLEAWTADFGILSFLAKAKERKIHFQVDLYKGTVSIKEQQ